MSEAPDLCKEKLQSSICVLPARNRREKRGVPLETLRNGSASLRTYGLTDMEPGCLGPVSRSEARRTEVQRAVPKRKRGKHLGAADLQGVGVPAKRLSRQYGCSEDEARDFPAGWGKRAPRCIRWNGAFQSSTSRTGPVTASSCGRTSSSPNCATAPCYFNRQSCAIGLGTCRPSTDVTSCCCIWV